MTLDRSADNVHEDDSHPDVNMHHLAPRTLPLLLTLMLPWSAAAEPFHWTDDGRIAAALDAGGIDETEALWLDFLRHFEPDELPLAYRGEQRPGLSCGTGLVLALNRAWETFSPAQQARMAPRVRPMATVTPPPPDTMEDDTCWGAYGEHRVAGEHFVVEWDGNTVSEAVAENFLAALEHSWEVEVEELGWRAPDGSDDYLMLTFISDDDWGGAYTTVDMCNGELLPYIVASSGSFAGGTWYQDMACHEFNHAMQFGYSYAHEFWWWEATATYIEDDVYPTHEGWSPYISGYTQNPWMAMNANSDYDYDRFMHMYGMAIFGFYLDQHVGGEDIVRQTWAATEGSYQQYSTTLEDLSEELGFDWDEAYEGFMIANTVMDYDDRQYYPNLDIERTVGSLPSDGESSENAPESLGQNYLRFNTNEASDDEPDLWLEFEGDEDGDWIVLLVGTEDDEVIEVVRLELEDGEGEGRLAAFGAFDRAYLVVSPTKFSTSAFDYSWTAEAVAPEPEADDDDDDGDDDKQLLAGEGCECSQATPSTSTGVLVATFLALLAVIRRR